MNNYLALIQFKIRYNLISDEYNHTTWPFQREKNVYIFLFKNKREKKKRKKKEKVLPHFRDNRVKHFSLLEILQVFLLNPTPQLLLMKELLAFGQLYECP